MSDPTVTTKTILDTISSLSASVVRIIDVMELDRERLAVLERTVDELQSIRFYGEVGE